MSVSSDVLLSLFMYPTQSTSFPDLPTYFIMPTCMSHHLLPRPMHLHLPRSVLPPPQTYLCNVFPTLACKQVTGKEEIQGIHWAMWTGVLGAEVLGIRLKYS